MSILKALIVGGQGHLRRCYATGSKLIETTKDPDTDISIISMASTPVNILNAELLNALKASLLEAKSNRSKGIVLTSSLPTVFSAGFDIASLCNEKTFTEFWHTLQDTCSTLYSMDIPTAVAINGASPAGGCLLAICTEYRVFVKGEHSIGLNEAQLGIVAPKWARDSYVSLLGYRQAELALLKYADQWKTTGHHNNDFVCRGMLFKPEEALKLGLVDEIATDRTDAIEKCKKYILSYGNIPELGRVTTKLQVRNDWIQWLKENKEADTKSFWNHVQLPQVQDNLQSYMERLKKKRR